FQNNTIVFDSSTINNKKVYFGTGYADIKAIQDNKVYTIFTDYTDNENVIYSKITDLKFVGNRMYFTTIFGLNCIDFSEKRLDKLYKKTRLIKDIYTSHLRKIGSNLLFIDNKVDLTFFNT